MPDSTDGAATEHDREGSRRSWSDRRVATPVIDAVAALVITSEAVALFTGFFGFGLGPKVAGAVIACSVAIARYRARPGKPETLPKLGQIAMAAAAAAIAGLGSALWSTRERDPQLFDFVAVPQGTIALVSLAPQPKTEVASAGTLTYGDKVRVRCQINRRGGRVWYQLESGYFLSDRDVGPAPLSTDGDPPNC